MTHPHDQNRLEWVDALRGYAIFLVIVYHVYQAIPNLNLSSQKLLDFFSIGVQLFFMVSAFTIFLTLERSKKQSKHGYRNFFIRRIFRLVPLFYLTLLINMFLLKSTSGGFSMAEFLSTVTFTSAWIPAHCPTLVPGGWSIAVEMWFYLLAPLLVTWIKTLRHSLYFVIIALFFRLVINEGLAPLLLPPSILNSAFLFFWLPNQAPLFALGILVFFLFKKWESQRLDKENASPKVASESYGLFFLLTGVYLLVASTVGFKALLPYHFLFGLSFLLIIQYMILKPRSFLVGRPIIGLGKISYSAYIMHFFVIRFSEDWFRVNITRWTDSAELQLGCYILFTMVFTILASTLLYWAVELPGQALGKRICKLGLPVTV